MCPSVTVAAFRAVVFFSAGVGRQSRDIFFISQGELCVLAVRVASGWKMMTCCVMRLKSPSGFLIPAGEKVLLVHGFLPLFSNNPFPGFRCASNFSAFAFVGLLIFLGSYGKQMTN